MRNKKNRMVFVEEAEVLAQKAYEGAQYILRLHAPLTATHAQPGNFAHIRCDEDLPLRRPLSIMGTDPVAGWVDFLYKVVGDGTTRLSHRRPGDHLNLMGPIGTPFTPHTERPRTLLVGGGVGLPPMVFLAGELREQERFKPLVILGSEVPFPFRPSPSRIMVPGMPSDVIAAMPMLEEWGVPSRLTSLRGYPGCHEGYVTDLARSWLEALDDQQRSEVELFSCGPHPMLEAVAKMAHEYAIPCQVSLEEFMACGIGGCAGCVVEVQTDNGPAMKRVCVDGPVFNADQVFSGKEGMDSPATAGL